MGISREVFFISTTVSLVYSGLTLIFPILPFYIELFGGGATEFGIASSSYALAILIFAPVVGRVADRTGKVPVIGLSLLGYGVTNFFYIFVTSNLQIIILRFIEGIFTAGVAPAAISIASDLSDVDHRARSIAFVTAGISAGIIMGPLLGGTLILYFPLYVPFVLSGFLGLVASVLTFVLISEPEIEREEEMVTVKFLDKLPRPFFSLFVFLVITFIVSFSWLVIEPGFVFYFYNVLHYNSQQFGIFVAAYGSFVFIGEVAFGGLSDRFGRKSIILVGSVFNSLFYVVLSFATTLWVLVLSAAIAGIAFGLFGPALNALLSEVTNSKFRTFVFGISTSVAGTAQIAGPLLGGWLIDDGGLDIHTIAIFSAVITTISGLLVIFLNFKEWTKDDIV